MLAADNAHGRRRVDRIEWDAALETGDAVVDLQHRAIHDLFNEICDADDDPSRILGVLDFLTLHVNAHFATEEDLMNREHFSRHLTDVHVAEHKVLTDGVREQVIAYREGRLTNTDPLLELIHTWLMSHVRDCDRVLIDHIRLRGVSAEMPREWPATGDSRQS
jgi:hemerythrin-like metal-binding protein